MEKLYCILRLPSFATVILNNTVHDGNFLLWRLAVSTAAGAAVPAPGPFSVLLSLQGTTGWRPFRRERRGSVGVSVRVSSGIQGRQQRIRTVL